MDADLLLENPGNTCAIPNSLSLPPVQPSSEDHVPELGVVLGSLTNRKRLDHAISAMELARDAATAEFELRIFGKGPEGASLRQLIVDRNLGRSVTLAGYSASAREEFRLASFTLLTSTLSVQGLVLLEAMSLGCIPIAYDVPYGPADIIDHGVNGFVVPDGDIAAMSDVIVKLRTLEPSAVDEMRREAVTTASTYSDAAIVRRWSAEMLTAANRKVGAALELKMNGLLEGQKKI